MKDQSLKNDDDKSANTEMDDLKAQIAVLKAALDSKPKVEEAAKPEVEFTEIHMDLAPSAGGAISHAGRLFVNGGTYRIEVHAARDILEIQNRGWSHESSLQTSENMGRQKLRQHVKNF